MARLADLPIYLTFFTQITMESAEDGRFLDAMRAAHIRGALVGVEAVTAEGLKAVFKDFNCSGEEAGSSTSGISAARRTRLGFLHFRIVDGPGWAPLMLRMELAHKSGLTFAQFVMLTPFCRNNVRLRALGKGIWRQRADGGGNSDHALLADSSGFAAEDVHAASHHEFRRDAGAHAGRLGPVLQHEGGMEAVEFARRICGRGWLSFSFSKLYRQMYASTGIATDSARRNRANQWARWLAVPCRKLFSGRLMPGLQAPHVNWWSLQPIRTPMLVY